MRLDEIRDRVNKAVNDKWSVTYGVTPADIDALLTIAEAAVKLRKAVAHYEDCTGPNHDPEVAWAADGALDEAQAAFVEAVDAFEEAAG
jgi:hypothetical protein